MFGARFLELLISLIDKLLIPLAIALAGWCISDALKEKDIRVKYVELAITILRDPPQKENTGLRTWATDVLNELALVKLPEEVKNDLIKSLPIYEPFVINQEIRVVDEKGRPIAGASVNLMKIISQSSTVLVSTLTDEQGKASLRGTDASGAKLEITVAKDGYETHTSEIQAISSIIIKMKTLR